MNDKEVYKIIYNWYVGEHREQNFKVFQLGIGGCTQIIEVPQYEGSRIYYDVLFSDGKAIRIFNPNEVFYQPLVQKPDIPF